MGIIQRQSISGFIYTLIGVLLGFVTTGLFMPFIFKPEEIGLLRVLISYATVMSTFSVLGFGIVSVKIFPFFRDSQSKHHGFLGLSLLVGFIGFVIAALVYLGLQHTILEKGAEKSPLFAQFFYLVIPLTFFMMLYTVFDNYFRVLYQTIIGIVYREVVQRFLILVVFGLFYLHYISFSDNVYLYALAYSLPTLFLLIALIKKGELRLVPDFKFLKKPLLKKMGHIGLFGIFTSFSGILVLNIDILMLNQLEGLTQTGIYSITFFFGALVLIPSRSMIKISSVIIADAFKRKDEDEVRMIYKKSSINLGIIGMLIWIGLWANLDNIFEVIGQDFSTGRWVIFIIGLANLLDMFMGTSNQIIFNSKYYTISAYQNMAFIVLLIVTNLLFIPMYGIVGAAIASLISKFLFNLFKYIFIRAKLKLQPFNIKTAYLIVLGLSTFGISKLLPELPHYLLDIIIRSLLITLVFGVGVLALNLSEDVNEWVKKLSGRVR